MKTRFVVVAAATLAACSPIRHAPYPVPPPSVTGRTLSRADALADLAFLIRTLEEVHPDVYAVRPRDSVAADRKRIEAGLPATMSRSDFWRRIAPLVASIGDGHTNLRYPVDEVLKLTANGELVFPPSVVLDAGGHATLGQLIGPAPGLARADRLIAINGLNTDSLIANWVLAQSGESQVYRVTSVVDRFRDLIVVNGIRAPFALTVASRDSAVRTVTMPGITRDSFAALIRSPRPGANTAPPVATITNANFTYQTLDGRVGYMNFRSMGGELAPFAANLDKMFVKLANDSAHALVIDLRSNGGGDSRLGDELLRHITTKPYRMSSRKDWKMSKQYRAFIKTAVKPPLGWLPIEYVVPTGRRMFMGPAGKTITDTVSLQAPKHAAPFFSGPVCFLIGTHTFSSATDLVDAVRTYNLATTIGEETGGHPTSFGEVYPFLLPKSGFLVSVSSARFVRANGDATDFHGVIPGIEIVPTPEDRRAGRDPVMLRARQCAK